MKNIYFNIRPTSRERMWDTPKNVNELCSVLLPKGVKQKSSISTFSLSSLKSKIVASIKFEISKYIINTQKINCQTENTIDLIYMWGAFPKRFQKPFIIELDNPYTPAYYHIKNFHSNKSLLKDKLSKAYKITFMSETSKNHFIELYGSEFEYKSFINYPYMNSNYKNSTKIKKDNLIDFIFVGMDFRRKGGVELLEAFYKIKSKQIRLTIISNTDETTKHLYTVDDRITFLPLQNRDVLMNEIYPNMDIMLFPSFHESFGVVLLEALSFGMGIITVNTYATHEIVEDGFNGKLLKHPFLKPSKLNNQLIVNCVDERISEFNDKYLNNDEFYYGLYHDLKDSIEEGIVKYKTWKINSLKKFDIQFSPDIWKKNFKKIIQ